MEYAQFSSGLLMFLVIVASLFGYGSCSNMSCCFSNISLGLTEVPFHFIHDGVLGIWLNENNIQRIDSFAPLPDLMALSLDDNEMIEFPELCNVSSSLLLINLERNHIEHIEPSRLDCLTKLVKLYLNQNHLKVIPDVAGPSSSLLTLEVILNRFEEVPILAVLGGNLIVYHFSTLSINMDDIPYMPWLSETVQVLGIGGLDIKRISPEKLHPLRYLRQLYLYYNKLTDIPDLGLLADSLEILELGHNPLQHVSTGRLNKLPKLINVKLNSCNLTRAPNLCRVGTNLTVVLTGNLFVCDCHMRWLKMAEMAGTKVHLSPKPCASPSHLIGMHWVNIPVDKLLCKDPIERSVIVEPLGEDVFSCDRWQIIEKLEHHVSSLIGCVSACLRLSDCTVFRWLRVSQTCSLVSFNFSAPTINTGFSWDGIFTI